jgi:hypothetical protein
MTSPQTSVPSEMFFGVPGQVADLHTSQDAAIESHENGEGANEIPYGHFVAAGAVGADGKAKAMRVAAAVDVLLGLAVFSQKLAYPTQIGDVGVKPGTSFGIARDGVYYVMPEDDVTPASGVHIRHTAAGGALGGSVRGAADAGKSIDASDFCRWRTSGGPTSGQCAELEIMLPAGASLATGDV